MNETVHICAPSATMVALDVQVCDTCGRRRRFVVARYEWYSPEITCLRCGDSWNADGRCERPFRRGWRKESIRSAWQQFKRFRSQPEVSP